jgi:hypothetical protein
MRLLIVCIALLLLTAPAWAREETGKRYHDLSYIGPDGCLHIVLDKLAVLEWLSDLKAGAVFVNVITEPTEQRPTTQRQLVEQGPYVPPTTEPVVRSLTWEPTDAGDGYYRCDISAIFEAPPSVKYADYTLYLYNELGTEVAKLERSVNFSNGPIAMDALNVRTIGLPADYRVVWKTE